MVTLRESYIVIVILLALPPASFHVEVYVHNLFSFEYHVIHVLLLTCWLVAVCVCVYV